MNYYDREKNKYKFNTINMNLIGSGSCGKVYKYNNNALKIYNDDTADNIRLKIKQFEQFKTITNPHFIRLIKVFPFKINQNFLVDAYESSFYEKDSTSIIEKPIDYLLDNIAEIEMLLTYLTNEHILTHDLRYHNVILQKNNIVLIDPDSFYFYTDSTRYIGNKNKENLVTLINTILYHSIMEYDEEIYNNWDKVLFRYSSYEKINVTHCISKTLKKYNTLKDFFTTNHK